MLIRHKEKDILDYLLHFPAVGVIGPRQCGKSTLARQIAKKMKGSVYLDLENPDDRVRLTVPSLFLSENKGKLVCLDEVQFMPEIFRVLRSAIDENKRNGQFLVLGSASPSLLRQSSETLAGRIVYVDLAPFSIPELTKGGKSDANRLWIRGGFPRSYLATNETLSMVWRKNFIRTFYLTLSIVFAGS